MKAGTQEYYAEYYQQHKEKHTDNMKRFRQENVEYQAKNLEYHKKKYTKNKTDIDEDILREKWRLQANKMVQERREFINEYKSKCSCKKCGETRPYVLDFHHLIPTQKTFELGNASTKGIQKIKKELEKCIPLCRNCHSEFHYLEKEQGITIKDYIN